jgi:hypothetical protein
MCIDTPRVSCSKPLKKSSNAAPMHIVPHKALCKCKRASGLLEFANIGSESTMPRQSDTNLGKLRLWLKLPQADSKPALCCTVLWYVAVCVRVKEEPAFGESALSGAVQALECDEIRHALELTDALNRTLATARRSNCLPGDNELIPHVVLFCICACVRAGYTLVKARLASEGLFLFAAITAALSSIEKAQARAATQKSKPDGGRCQEFTASVNPCLW